jgi:group I intron endonuclease
MTGIYKITSPTGRIYIGQSIDIDKRFSTYFQLNSKTKSQIRLYRSFLKYGVNNHIFEVIKICEIDELNKEERYYQDLYDVTKGGLNCVLQETDCLRRVLSDETKEKIRIKNIGKKVSSKNIENTRKRMTGNKYNLGRKKTDEEKKKISDTMKKISKKENNNMFGKYGEDNPNSKIILNIQTGIFYFGVNEASFFGNISRSSLKKKICNYKINNTSFIYA